MKNWAARLQEIRNTIRAECGDTQLGQFNSVLSHRTNNDIDTSLNVLDMAGLSDAVSFDLGVSATKSGRPHRRLVRALLFVRGLQKGMSALDISTLKQKYLNKSGNECRQMLQKAFTDDPMWAANDLNAFNFRVTFMDQKLLTANIKEHSDGICSGLAVLWLKRILALPGENAWNRLHWAKKQKDTAEKIQGQRQLIGETFDKQFGEMRGAQFDELMHQNDPEGRIATARSKLGKMPTNVTEVLKKKYESRGVDRGNKFPQEGDRTGNQCGTETRRQCPPASDATFG